MNLSLSQTPPWNISSSWSDISNASGLDPHHNVTPPVTSLSTSQPELTLTDRLLMLSKEQRALSEEILLIIRYVIFALALPATVCNIVVFLQRDMRSATSVYVIGLSAGQLLYIFTNMLDKVISSAIENRMNNKAYLIYGIYVSSYLSITVRRASYLIMCFLSLERLYAILRPFHVKEFVLTRFPVLFTVAACVLAATWHVFMLVKSSVVEMQSSRTGKLVYVFRYTDIYMENPEIADGFGAAAPIFMTYIPLLSLIALNVATIWALRRHNVSTQRVKSSTNEEAKRQRERQMTLTILVTTICYVILSLPYAFHNLLKNVYEEYDKRKKYNNLYYVMRSCAFTLTVLTCVIDFCCFILLSSNFRKTFFRLFRIRFAKRGNLMAGEASSFNQTLDTDVDTK